MVWQIWIIHGLRTILAWGLFELAYGIDENAAYLGDCEPFYCE